MGRKVGAAVPCQGELGSHLTQCGLARGLYLPTKWHLDLSSRLATTDMDQKYWGLCPFGGGGAGFPSNTMWPGPRPISTPSFILQYTNVTERQTDRQRSYNIGRTVLQMVAQKSACGELTLLPSDFFCCDLQAQCGIMWGVRSTSLGSEENPVAPPASHHCTKPPSIEC